MKGLIVKVIYGTNTNTCCKVIGVDFDQITVEFSDKLQRTYHASWLEFPDPSEIVRRRRENIT
tara:strand:+ start:327 stop:515 length:189 start_codon:yes stop_codon:yes gene_type:complete